MPNENSMNSLPQDIEAFLAEAALEFRTAMADQQREQREQYERSAIAASQSPDEPGYEVENTK